MKLISNDPKKKICQLITCDIAFKHCIEIVYIRTTIYNGCFYVWQTQWSKKCKVLIWLNREMITET